MLIAVLAAFLILLTLTGETPTEDITEPENGAVDCEVAYLETFAEWQTYLTDEDQEEEPSRPEPSDPCFLDRLRAQIDAFQAAAPPVVPPPSGSPPPPLVAPNPQPPTAPPPLATPPLPQGPPPGSTPAVPVGTPGPSGPPDPRLAALQASSNAQIVVTCTSASQFGAGPLLATDSNNVIFVLALVINGGQAADSPNAAFKLSDSRGRQYDMLSAQAPGYSAMVSEIQRNGLPGGLEVVSVASSIQPGRNAAVPMLFEVAPDAQDLRLVASRTC